MVSLRSTTINEIRSTARTSDQQRIYGNCCRFRFYPCETIKTLLFELQHLTRDDCFASSSYDFLCFQLIAFKSKSTRAIMTDRPASHQLYFQALTHVAQIVVTLVMKTKYVRANYYLPSLYTVIFGSELPRLHICINSAIPEFS